MKIVGGESWKMGKGREFEAVIRIKCEKIIKELNKELDGI